ncbi:MAG: helix-turn-helix transcriptional regulator [Planctomycetes bacterium]|nr:helix-turn-helix transcriptional regulator [Planctomycetota bacterium]
MNTGLFERIRELRRRHFGATGKTALAEKLGLPLAEYERYERGTIPPADVFVRLCEITGEDLQWLLTGVAARGTVVISGARGRHQNLLARVAQALESQPQLAAPIEAFVDLLLNAPQRPAPLPAPAGPSDATCLVPIFRIDELPEQLTSESRGALTTALALPTQPEQSNRRDAAGLSEPATSYENAAVLDVSLVSAAGDSRPARRYIECPLLAECAPAVLGVETADASMAPMFQVGDTMVIAITAETKLGRPALCKFAGGPARCRVWLGVDGLNVNLGRVADGGCEHEPRASLQWSYEVIYRVAAA